MLACRIRLLLEHFMHHRPAQPNRPNKRRTFPEPHHSASKFGGYMGWLLLQIAPIPIGLLIGSIHIFDSIVNGTKGLFVFFVILTLACSVVGAIGQFGGFRKASLGRFAAGIFTGMWVAAFDITVVFFSGCCYAIGHINHA